MTDKKMMQKLDFEIDNFVQRKYYYLSKDITENIKIEKKNEILGYLKQNNIDIKDEEHITNLIETPIYKIAIKNFENIIKIKEEKKNKLENVSYSNAYKCYKCGNNKTSVVYVQTRSCDEPMTAFVKCIKCQNQFVK